MTTETQQSQPAAPGEAQSRRSQDQGDYQLSITLVSGLIVILGVAALYFLYALITGDADFQEVLPTGDTGQIILIFLQSFGILVPVSVIAIGLYLIRLGYRLYQRDIAAAMWARLVLLWLTVAVFVGIVLTAVDSQNLGQAVTALLPWVGLGGVLIFAMLWMMNNEDVFEGQETLMSRSTRTAWNLLVPTVLVLVVVAARPLEQTFIVSLTNQRFASTAREIRFVGLDNYAQLLGVRFDTIPCATDEDTGDCLVENGQTVYPRERNYLIDVVDGYRAQGYRPVSTYNIFGSRIALSARDHNFISAIGNTLTFTVLSVSLELMLGLFIAMVVNSKFPGRGLMRAAMLVPWAIPTVISARLWEVMLRDGRSGVINEFLLIPDRLFGFRVIDGPQAWLTNADWQIPALVMVDVWKTTPFMALLLLAGLQVIPKDVYEAADVDGASKVRQFFNITLPLLRPTIAVALVFRTLDAIRVFDVFQVLLGERRLSLATYNYTTLVSNQEFGYASAIGVVIFIIILLFTIAYVRVLGIEAK
jgi:trehalose/maltose transport system permease protein